MEHPGTVADQLNITQNISGTPRNNGTIQNKDFIADINYFIFIADI